MKTIKTDCLKILVYTSTIYLPVLFNFYFVPKSNFFKIKIKICKYLPIVFLLGFEIVGDPSVCPILLFIKHSPQPHYLLPTQMIKPPCSVVCVDCLSYYISLGPNPTCPSQFFFNFYYLNYRKCSVSISELSKPLH